MRAAQLPTMRMMTLAAVLAAVVASLGVVAWQPHLVRDEIVADE